MARSSKNNRSHFLKWLIVGAAVSFAYIFLFPSQQSNQDVEAQPMSGSNKVSESSEYVYFKASVPVSKEDATQTELFVFTRPNHLWNAVSEFCVRVHTAGSTNPSWPWPSLEAMFQTVHNSAIETMGPAVAAEAEQAYLSNLNQKKMARQELAISDGRKLSITTVWDEEKSAIRKRAARFNKLHGFKAGEPLAHVVECIMSVFSFLNIQQPAGTVQAISVIIPKYFAMLSNSSFGTRSSGRKVLRCFETIFWSCTIDNCRCSSTLVLATQNFLLC
jgi:hypothetical protein